MPFFKCFFWSFFSNAFFGPLFQMLFWSSFSNAFYAQLLGIPEAFEISLINVENCVFCIGVEIWIVVG